MTKIIRQVIGVAFLICLGSFSPVVAQSLLQHESQIDDIIKGMTLEEKIAMLHGKNMFSSEGVPRLGIADIEYADGPFGIREEMEPRSWNSAHLTTDSATFFPTGSALAATWSYDWAYAYGKAMSREDILSAVWGGDFSGELKTVDVNIRRLRIKIESDPTEPEYLTTVWGYGYKWGY